jgi:hypothetical protein
VIFPTFWTHAHCGQIPRSEDKYIVSSFVSFAIPAASQEKGPAPTSALPRHSRKTLRKDSARICVTAVAVESAVRSPR